MKKNLKLLLCTTLFIMMLFTSVTNVLAASGNISISSSTSKVVVGGTFNVTVKLSSGESMGTLEYSLKYDTGKFKLTSGREAQTDLGGSSVFSKSYSFTFKAIGTGNGTISVGGSALAYSDGSNISFNNPSKTVTVITQAQKQASYSSNNNLSALSVEGYELSPAFNASTLEYKVSVPSNVEKVKINATKADSKASINGAGEIAVVEGDNKINITVTAENGSAKTYVVTVSVIDDNPINVEIDGKKYTIVKRASVLKAPENYTATELTINEIKVPSFYSEINNYNLVGLKDEEGNISLYVYEESKKQYTLYKEVSLDKLLILPLKMDKKFDKNYVLGTVTINEVEFESYSLKDSKYSIIHAQDLTKGTDDYYLYSLDTNTIIKYTDEQLNLYKDKSDKYYQIIILLCGESIILFIILISVLINKIIKNSKKRKLIKMKKEEIEHKEEIESKKKEEIKEEIKEEKESKNKEKVKDEDKSDKIVKETKKKKSKKKDEFEDL